MTDIIIEGGTVLTGGELAETTLSASAGAIVEIDGPPRKASLAIDASGLLVLPGIVDLHGDAFERQIMPRPNVDFPIDVALLDTDRQMIANGITTTFHGITWSWEPGLRGAQNAQALVSEVDALRARLAVDTRLHLRHEVFNLDAEETILGWIRTRQIDLLAFNNHIGQALPTSEKPTKRKGMAERTGLTLDAFDALAARVHARAGEVPASIARLAAACSNCGVPMLSHDDETPLMRQGFRALGVNIAEFPINEPTAQDAAAAGEAIVFGAPNVVRGGSHTGWVSAREMVSKGLCSVLASDYYYPALPLAAFRLAREDVLPLPQAWELISAAPARAAGLADRGELVAGRRADVVLVDACDAFRPRIVAVIARGKLVHINEVDRLSRPSVATHPAAAA